jgi:uncharacterized protein
MTFTAYEATIPVMLRGLRSFDRYLDEASNLATVQNKPISEVLNGRLAPDMLTFAEQIDIGCSKAQRHAAALCDLDRPKSSPVQPSLDALRGRVRDTQQFLEKLPVDALSNAETRSYWLSEPLVEGWLFAGDYIFQLILPDFFFHVTVAHAILRHLGSSIGKRDYLALLDVNAGGYS